MDLVREKYKNSHPTVEVEAFGPTIDIGKTCADGSDDMDCWNIRYNYSRQVESGYSTFNLGPRAINGTGLKIEKD